MVLPDGIMNNVYRDIMHDALAKALAAILDAIEEVGKTRGFGRPLYLNPYSSYLHNMPNLECVKSIPIPDKENHFDMKLTCTAASCKVTNEITTNLIERFKLNTSKDAFIYATFAENIRTGPVGIWALWILDHVTEEAWKIGA